MKKTTIAIIAFFLLLYIVPLGMRPLVMPDEFRYAEIPREMLASGDWIVPHLNGVPYFEKPVLGYWLSAAAIALFGENAFAVRFPSAVAVGLTALLLFVLMQRFSADRSVALLTAAAFLICPMVFGVGTFNVLDSVLSLFLTAAMVSFFFSYMEENPAKKRVYLALFGVSCGLAFLTKGFLAFAVPLVAITPFMVWEGRWRELIRLFSLPLGTAALIVLPWSLMIHLQDHQFWHYFFWIEHIKRFMSENAPHPEPLWYFIPIMAGGALPWIILLPAAIPGLKGRHLENPLVRFTLCWLLFPFLFFSASHGKLGTYILPCFPPFVALITVGLMRSLREGKTQRYNIAVSFFAVLVTLGAVILSLSQYTDLHASKIYGATESWKWVLIVAALLTWSALSVLSVRSLDYKRKLMLYCGAPLLLMFSAHLVVPDQAREGKMPGELVLRNLERVSSDTILVSDKYLALTVSWIYKRNDVYICGDGGELAWGLSYDDTKHRLLTPDEFKKLARKESGKNRLIYVTFLEEYAGYRDHLPPPAFMDTYGLFVFIEF